MEPLSPIERFDGPQPMREAYKFFSSKFLDLIRDRGSVRIGTARSFRKDDGYDDGRADREEMVTRWAPTGNFTSRHPFMKAIGAPQSGPEIPVIVEPGATTFALATDAFLICLSDGLDDQLCAGMLDKFNCDMIYRIPNLGAYINALRLANQRLREGAAAPVTYDVPDGFQSEFSPMIFRKRKQFSWQREIRLVFQHSQAHEPFTIESTTIVKLIEIMPNPAATQQ